MHRSVALVSWQLVPGKGRGVVAVVACKAGTEVERSPVVVVPADDLLVRPHGRTVPDQYLLHWSEAPGRELAMGLGLLMLYNHSNRPNVAFETGPEPDTMSVLALRDIAAGEELTYDYDVPLWFVTTTDTNVSRPHTTMRSKSRQPPREWLSFTGPSSRGERAGSGMRTQLDKKFNWSQAIGEKAQLRFREAEKGAGPQEEEGREARRAAGAEAR